MPRGQYARKPREHPHAAPAAALPRGNPLATADAAEQPPVETEVKAATEFGKLAEVLRDREEPDAPEVPTDGASQWLSAALAIDLKATAIHHRGPLEVLNVRLGEFKQALIAARLSASPRLKAAIDRAVDNI